MTKTVKQGLTSKWLLVVSEYERVKHKKSSSFRTVEELCRAYQVHRKDIRKYYQRWINAGRDRLALLPHPRGPRPGQLKLLSKSEERVILKINRRLGANQFEIYELIKDHQNRNGHLAFKVHPSVSTIYRTFQRYPLNQARKEQIKRYEKSYPGELAHTDTFVLSQRVVGEKRKHYLFGLLDDCTRLCYVELISDLKASTATQAFFNGYRWFYLHGIKIERVLSDNGGEYTAYTSRKAKQIHFFETMLKIFAIKHSYTQPYRPQTNGKIERFWKILNQECLRLQTKSQTKEEFVAELSGFMYRYNYQRRHGGLDYQTPLEKLKCVTEILK